MSVMQKRPDGADLPESGKPHRPTKAKRKGKAATPKRRPARKRTSSANKADEAETK